MLGWMVFDLWCEGFLCLLLGGIRRLWGVESRVRSILFGLVSFFFSRGYVLFCFGLVFLGEVFSRC